MDFPLFLAKSLIVEWKFITSRLGFSIKSPVLSIKLPFSSIARFFGWSALSLSFSLVNKEKREGKASIKEKAESINPGRCLFFNPSVVLRISRNWWIVMDEISLVFNGLRVHPSISTNPPVFSPSPPWKRVFYGLH